MPRYRLVSAIAVGALAAAVACDSFSGGGDSTPAEPPPEAGAIDDANGGGNPEGGNVVDADQPSSVQPDGLYLTCPPTSTKSKFKSSIPTRIVQAQTGYDFPFGIVTDSSSVYWVSQFTADASATTNPANGHSKARIHRASKTAVDAPLDQTILVDEEPAETVAVALDGDYLYWAAVKDSVTVQIRRVTRSCTAPCTSENYHDVPAARPIVRMRRGEPGLIFAMTDQGQVFGIDTVHNKILSGLQPTASLPSFAVLEESTFVSWLADPKVRRVGADGAVEHSEFPATDASPRVGGILATDCTHLFAWRTLDGDLWSADARKPSPFDKFATVDRLDVYDAFADHDYVYLGSANGQGLAVIDIVTRAVAQKFIGTYWRVWADDTGAYAGDHSSTTPGSIYRFGD